MRADKFLTQHGYYDSRARAQAAIKAGLVRVDGRVLKKASEILSEAHQIKAGQEHPWVSRGGLKLVKALDVFHVNPKGLTCLDVGASTGGFTHVLHARGALKIYAVDVGHGQLHSDLQNISEIMSLEGQDARGLTPQHFDPLPSLIVCDASFISLNKVLDIPMQIVASGSVLVTLVKPQFEVGRDGIGKGGLVKSESLALQALSDVSVWIETQGWRVLKTTTSPIKGGSGNKEYLLHAVKS